MVHTVGMTCAKKGSCPWEGHMQRSSRVGPHMGFAEKVEPSPSPEVFTNRLLLSLPLDIQEDTGIESVPLASRPKMPVCDRSSWLHQASFLA